MSNQMKAGVGKDGINPKVLTIAGSDPSGGAGIQADLKTIALLGGYGMSVITGLTAQNTLGVQGIHLIPGKFIAQQLDSIFSDIVPDTIKTGMLGDVEQIQAVSDFLKKQPNIKLVVDPVMYAKGGAALLNPEAVNVMLTELLPLAYLVTPNTPEAAKLSGIEINKPEDFSIAATAILDSGIKRVLIKGGHGHPQAWDYYADAHGRQWLENTRIDNPHTHGTGCTLSAAIAIFLAYGLDGLDACIQARKFLHYAITYAYPIGKGISPVNHWKGAEEYFRNK